MDVPRPSPASSDEPEVSQLARSIIESQRAEIENMKAMADKRVGDSAEVDLEPANGSGTTGTATLSKAKGGSVKVVLTVSGLPNSAKMYLAHIHPGTSRPLPPRARCFRGD